MSVRPVLASTLLDAARSKRRAVEQSRDAAPPGRSAKRRRINHLRSGHPALDEDVLEGGFSYGSGGVVGVACDETRTGVELAYSTLTSHLLDSPKSQAFYIDTSKTFDPRRLHKKLVSRLEAKKAIPLHDGGYVYRKADEKIAGALPNDVESVEKTVMAALDRVNMMRVFDLEGLMDAVMEVRARLEARASKLAADEDVTSVKHDGVDVPTAMHGLSEVPGHDARSTNTITTAPERKKAVADSQAPSDTSDLEKAPPGTYEDDDMLLDLSEPEVEDTVVRNAPIAQPKCTSPMTEIQSTEGPYLLIMPSPARILSSCMHTNHIKTHALLVHLMRSLQLLTRTYAISILLINTTVERESITASGREDGPSAFFANNRIKPALGKTWDWYLDLSCMITSALDSGHGKQGSGRLARGKEQCFEVLHDRYERRTGRWAVIRA